MLEYGLKDVTKDIDLVCRNAQELLQKKWSP